MSEQIEVKVSGRVLLRGEIRGGVLVTEAALAVRSWVQEVGLSSAKEGGRDLFDVPAALLPDLLERLRDLGPEVTDHLRARLSPLLALAARQHEANHQTRGSVVQRMSPTPVQDDLLMPFQREGVGWLLATGGVGLVGDDMGLGKTAQALGYLRHAGIRRAVVVCPASVVLNWCREASRFHGQATPVPILSAKDLERFKLKPPPEPWVVVLTWDGMRRMWSELARLDPMPEALVADEAHYGKSLEAQRTRALVWFGSLLPHRILLSGTPMRNRPRELFPLLHLLDPVQFRSFLPYDLVFDMRVTRVEQPSALEGHATGELEGEGRWTFTETLGGTHVRYQWDVRTTRWWMNLLAPIASPVFAWNHGIVMRWGEAGLRRRLRIEIEDFDECALHPRTTTRPGDAEPHLGFADVRILLRRSGWTRERLAPRPPRLKRGWRCRARHDRGDRRHAGGPHQPARPRHLVGRTR